MEVTKKIPTLRFPGFEGEWEEKKLKEVAAFKKGNTLSKSDLNSEGQKCILYGELYTKYGPIIKEVYSRTCCENKNLFYAKKGDVLIPSSGETAIDIATASCLQVDDVIIGGDLTVLTNIEEMDSRFISYQINGVKKQKLSTFAQGATVIHLYANHLKDFKVSNPSFPEQQKIADCLTAMDDTIEAQQQKVEQLKAYKKGLLQQLFSQTLRFPGFEGEWEEKKLGEVGIFSKGGTLSKQDLSSEGTSCILYGELYTTYNASTTVVVSKTNVLKTKLVFAKKNDVLIPASSTTDDVVTATCLQIDNVAVGGDINKLTPSTSNGVFISYAINSVYKNKISTLAQGATIFHLYSSHLEKFKMLFPSLPEQQKIADCLSTLDEVIELEQQKLEKLQVYKKGLLQQLFV